MADSALLNIELPGLEKIAQGKVRDIFAVDADHLLLVASDRLSAFDVIMNNGIPDKGKILTQLSVFWFSLLGDMGPHHLVTANVDDMPAAVRAHASTLRGRSMLVKRCEILPVEAIVRGYLAGSGWKEYGSKQTVCDIPLPAGLLESSALPEVLYTPSSKAAIGDHDENISPDKAEEILGEWARPVAERAIATYSTAANHARERGLILADTKFEFGIRDGQLILADEVLTPDSSRYWPADDYEPGRSQHAFDKQFVRDYLESINFDKSTPVTLPDEVISATRDRYLEAYQRITGTAADLS